MTSSQQRFLHWIGSLIPALLRVVERGSVESRWILGRRRLKDGRDIELSLVAKASETNKMRSYYTHHGGANVSDDDSRGDPTPAVDNATDEEIS